MVPENLVIHQESRVLEVTYTGGETMRIPLELMRVYSPSAEVRGHGQGQEVLQSGNCKLPPESPCREAVDNLERHFEKRHTAALCRQSCAGNPAERSVSHSNTPFPPQSYPVAAP
ncbi:MAG: gamma-butyrobetaine hydroxylase-like domain-containing protein [Burkholderiaceae bacterium]|nr:gamma-butyrobetaine hydroxylase-like domain-containing protein [Burkholderiaceae bacterium]